MKKKDSKKNNVCTASIPNHAKNNAARNGELTFVCNDCGKSNLKVLYVTTKDNHLTRQYCYSCMRRDLAWGFRTVIERHCVDAI